LGWRGPSLREASRRKIGGCGQCQPLFKSVRRLLELCRCLVEGLDRTTVRDLPDDLAPSCSAVAAKTIPLSARGHAERLRPIGDTRARSRVSPVTTGLRPPLRRRAAA
jgi:hypothetical protein